MAEVEDDRRIIHDTQLLMNLSSTTLPVLSTQLHLNCPVRSEYALQRVGLLGCTQVAASTRENALDPHYVHSLTLRQLTKLIPVERGTLCSYTVHHNRCAVAHSPPVQIPTLLNKVALVVSR